MAKDLVTLVDLLYGKQAARKFIAYGHDRGARVAHRMALDHADRLLGVALLDIVPTTSMWEQMRLDNGRHKEVNM
jgi:haloacetate dehalogenase